MKTWEYMSHRRDGCCVLTVEQKRTRIFLNNVWIFINTVKLSFLRFYLVLMKCGFIISPPRPNNTVVRIVVRSGGNALNKAKTVPSAVSHDHCVLGCLMHVLHNIIEELGACRISMGLRKTLYFIMILHPLSCRCELSFYFLPRGHIRQI